MPEDTFEGGELVICGSTDWAMVGRVPTKKKTDKEKNADAERQAKYPPLTGPHRIKQLLGIKIKFVAAGPTATHTLAVDADGQVWSWGRNERGQLGHGDHGNRNSPTVVPGLASSPAVSAACGRHHSVVVCENGSSYAWGQNACGQLGIGSMKPHKKGQPEEMHTTATKCAVAGASAVACGAEFTLWLCDGKVLSAGSSQYGQLGHNTDGEFNSADSSIKLEYQKEPTPLVIQALAGVKVIKIACGNNHSAAVADDGSAYTWGWGGYGRLGHKEQKDEWKPRKVDVFTGRNTIPVAEGCHVACGSAVTAFTGIMGQLYTCGKVKQTGDSVMYPKPLMELSGWALRDVSVGNTTVAVASETSAITFGTAGHGELGYGPTGPKSSANPKKVNALEGLLTHRVACGAGHTLFVVDPESEAAKFAKIPIYDPPADDPPPVEGGAKKRGPPPKKAKK